MISSITVRIDFPGIKGFIQNITRLKIQDDFGQFLNNNGISLICINLIFPPHKVQLYLVPGCLNLNKRAHTQKGWHSNF